MACLTVHIFLHHTDSWLFHNSLGCFHKIISARTTIALSIAANGLWFNVAVIITLVLLFNADIRVKEPTLESLCR
jgi:hypothetical protein